MLQGDFAKFVPKVLCCELFWCFVFQGESTPIGDVSTNTRSILETFSWRVPYLWTIEDAIYRNENWFSSQIKTHSLCELLFRFCLISNDLRGWVDAMMTLRFHRLAWGWGAVGFGFEMDISSYTCGCIATTFPSAILWRWLRNRKWKRQIFSNKLISVNLIR